MTISSPREKRTTAMPFEQPPNPGRGALTRAMRHHLAIVVLAIAAGSLMGWMYAGSVPATYTSTTRVLVNPTAGNPFTPTPASVRQDEETSLATEAQVARSAEVLDSVIVPGRAPARLERHVRVTVPPNTQILEISFTAADPVAAQQVTDAIASAYLANRERRFGDVTDARIERLETQTLRVVDDLRAATAAAQVGSAAKRAFNNQLADALRNELVSLRAQRTSLENLEAPAGTVISPAARGARVGTLTPILQLVAGALGGLVLGCLVALLLERATGKVRSTADVEASGLPVMAVVPQPRRHGRGLATGNAEEFETALRRLRTQVLDQHPRPGVVTVAPVGLGGSDHLVSEALAESCAKAGHQVVLVRTDGEPAPGSLAIEHDGLAEVLLHERLNVQDLLQPSVEPLLSLLPAGRMTAQTRDLLNAERLRTALDPLVDNGYLVVVQSPGIETVEGESFLDAADQGLLVVTVGRSRPRDLASLTTRARRREGTLSAVVVGRRLPFRRASSSRLADHAPSNPSSGVHVPGDGTTQEHNVGVIR
jgi:polysaccharide biosynthesis transport protein